MAGVYDLHFTTLGVCFAPLYLQKFWIVFSSIRLTPPASFCCSKSGPFR
nr:MAG TPA: hypothetical protein [Bacteriophage sp.]